MSSRSSISTYPIEIAAALRERWLQSKASPANLPDESVLRELLDTMYQASLLCEEGDPVKCRILFSPGQQFGQCRGTAHELLGLKFAVPVPFTPHELRKLAAAAGYYRVLLGVEQSKNGELCIWGMVITGTEWVNRVEGGRFAGPPLPPDLVIQILGPGRLTAASGYSRVLESANGKLLLEGFDPFRSLWLPARFGSVRESLMAQLGPPKQKARICESFVKDVTQGVVRRVLSLVRTRGYGGMLVYLPDDLADHSLVDRWFRFRVRFVDDPATHRFQKLLLQLMARVLEVGNAEGLSVCTWRDFSKMRDTELAVFDDELIQFAHFLADLMSVDGSLVLDRSFRIIGFGAEILGDSPAMEIHRALDLEAESCLSEPADSSGTRHRSAYRLVKGFPEAIAIVVSQDGDVRFVAHHNQKLAYWPYLP